MRVTSVSNEVDVSFRRSCIVSSCCTVERRNLSAATWLIISNMRDSTGHSGNTLQ